MDRGAVDKVVYEIEQLSYLDKLSVFSKVFSLGKLNSVEFNEKLVLISLVALTTQKLREKDPTITPLKVLLKITGQVPDDSGFYQYLEGLACLVEDASYGCTKFDPCGCKTSDEIINKIKTILSSWLPF